MLQRPCEEQPFLKDVLEKFTPWWQTGVASMLSKLSCRGDDVIVGMRSLTGIVIRSEYINTIHKKHLFISYSAAIREAFKTWQTSALC